MCGRSEVLQLTHPEEGHYLSFLSKNWVKLIKLKDQRFKLLRARQVTQMRDMGRT